MSDGQLNIILIRLLKNISATIANSSPFFKTILSKTLRLYWFRDKTILLLKIANKNYFILLLFLFCLKMKWHSISISHDNSTCKLDRSRTNALTFQKYISIAFEKTSNIIINFLLFQCNTKSTWEIHHVDSFSHFEEGVKL